MNRLWRVFRSSWFLAPSLAATLCVAAEPAAQSPSGADANARIAYYRKRIHGPGRYPAHARLGLAYAQKARETGKGSHYQDALRHLRQSLEYQRNFEALWGMAVVLSEQHRFREALGYAEEAVAAMPANLEAQGALFDIRLALGDVSAAETICDLMLKTGPGFHACARLAALRQYRGDYSGAAAAMIQARDWVSTNAASQAACAWAEVRLGSLFVAQCQTNEALAAYERALQLAPGYFFAVEHLAEWHAAQENWSEAGRLFRDLMKTRSEPQYRLALAEVLRHQGKPKPARREEERSLAELRRSVRAGAQDALRPLALLLLEREDALAEGLRWAERDWQLRPDALAADTLAWAHWRNGQSEEAIELSRLALQSGTKEPRVLLHAGLIRSRSGSVAEGQALARAALACPLALGAYERKLAAASGVERIR